MELKFSGFTQRFERGGEPFIPRIYAGEGALPEGFNGKLVTLDASEHATLKWELPTDASLLLWELDFALTADTLADEQRFLALELAVDHFSKTVWPQFEDKTLGVVLYRGEMCDLHPIKLLASHLPDSVRPFVFLETDPFPDAKSYFRAINQEVLGPLTPILRGKWAQKYPYASPALAWEHAQSPLGGVSEHVFTPLPEKRVPQAVYLPKEGDFPLPSGDFRVIPEQILTHEWDGVDQLYVEESSVTERGRRKLHGFVAAGGEVI